LSLNSKDIDKFCKSTYDSPEIAKSYLQAKKLKPPELSVIRILQNKLSKMKMLDIGVGAGRTTSFFARLTKKYIGIDYSSTMINVCRNRFPGINFEVADARDLTLFENNQFDFVLFSFNGLDYMNMEDRIKALREIRRVTNKEGYFCFSTHNLNYAPELLKVRLPKSLQAVLFEPIRLYRFHSLYKNIRNESKKVPYMIINDGAHDFKLLTLYIKPEEQVKQLLEIGFGNVRIFGSDGREILPRDCPNIKDWYPYFLVTHLANCARIS
jgi:ubiquinone/menaquinone biosynthesis C-methylase UbiE